MMNCPVTHTHRNLESLDGKPIQRKLLVWQWIDLSSAWHNTPVFTSHIFEWPVSHSTLSSIQDLGVNKTYAFSEIII